ncbi:MULTISPECIES: hypothetical protein [Pseudomonas]|nr:MULTISPECIES: hypothetical protein [Pseudomonas]
MFDDQRLLQLPRLHLQLLNLRFVPALLLLTLILACAPEVLE